MDFKDASARFKSKKAQTPDGEAAQPKPHDFAESYRLRAKMLGVLLRDARVNAERSIEDCAYLLRVSPEEMQAWEFGEAVPSLPQLELLAYYLGVPVSHFWGTDTLEAKVGRHVDIQLEYLALRNRMVGALLRQAREEAGLSLEQLSEASSVPAERIQYYELGESALPMHELTVLASAVKKNLSYFLESSGHVGEWLAIREEWKHFSDLPEEVRQFAANPLNVGFIHIAKALAEMPTEKLREVGESVLNITM
jgi:transcriptional regulator with XRE-family HTH domain